jgi:sugar lactone lactonase YvrE
MNSEIAIDVKSELGEGPGWDSENGRLYWVDILRGLVHVYEPDKSRDTTVRAGEYVSCVVPRKTGGIIITLQHGFYGLDLESGKLSTIAEVEKDLDENRFNDGKCDPAGRLWAGTMDMKERIPSGALYCLTMDGRVNKILSQVLVSNGLGWSPDNRTMYYIDSPTRKVSALDYNMRTGDVNNRRTAVDFADQPGEPDGMAVDAEGMIWVAHWGGHRVTRWNPTTGRLLDFVALPTTNVTSCCFGGRNLDELYITTARSGVDRETLSREPLSGCLFRARVGVRGLPTYVFGG